MRPAVLKQKRFVSSSHRIAARLEARNAGLLKVLGSGLVLLRYRLFLLQRGLARLAALHRGTRYGASGRGVEPIAAKYCGSRSACLGSR
jgi:hypothetical protein